MKKELFEDIKIFNKKGGVPFVHTIGWKFTYKKNQYGNYISDQVSTGRTYTYWDVEEECEYEREIMKTISITPKMEIALMEKMIEVMKRLVKGK